MPIRVCMHGVEIGPSKENVIAGGIPNSIIRLAKILNSNIKTVIISNDRKFRECNIKTEHFQSIHTKFHFVLIKGKYASLKYFFEYTLKIIFLIRKLNQTDRIDIIHGHSGHPALGVTTALSGFFTGIPTVHTFYCPIKPNYNLIIIYRYFISHIKTIIAISDNVQTSLVNAGIPKEKIKIIPVVIDLSEYKWKANRISERNQLQINENEFVILYLGNLTTTKGIDKVLKALNLVKEKNFEFKLISGLELTHTGNDKRKKEIFEMISELNLKNNIIELGLIQNVSEIMNASDIIVAPFQHTFDVADYPLTVLEGMAVGIPVITTGVGGIPEIVIHEKTGFLVNFEDYHNLAEIIMYLMNESSIIKEIGENASIFVRQKFSEDSIMELTKQMYMETINGYSS